MTATRRHVILGAATVPLTLGGATQAIAGTSAGYGDDEQGGQIPIICLEEHVNDPAVAQATMQAFAASVPYFAGLGSRYRESPQDYATDRPSLTFVPDSIRVASGPLADRIAAMDAAQIDMQVVSLSNTPQLASGAAGLDLVRAANDRLAEAAERYPGRFSAFFTLPWQDPDAAAIEADRCVTQLGLPATLLNGRPDGDRFIDDARFSPVLEQLARLNTPIYIHPGPPVEAVRKPYYSGFNSEIEARLPLFGWGWHHEAGIQVIRLILSGVLDRNPELEIISGHWGEMVPFFLQRLDDTMPPQATGLSRTISQTYRDQVWVTPSGMLDLPHFQFVRDVVGAERILFSLDYPYLTMTAAREWLESLPISRAEREAIAWRNASALLGIRPGSATET